MPRILSLPCLVFLLLASVADVAPVQDGEPIVNIGSHRLQWVADWMKRPEGEGTFGATHGQIVIDGKGLVYVNTETANAVCVFDAEGKFVRGFGADLANGLHGMVLNVEDGKEYLYLAHHGRHEVWKTTTEGEVVFKLGYPEASHRYTSADEFRPTAVAVAPDGSFFVADGYGKSWIHKYDAKGNYLSTFGGPGSEPGQLRSPHGLWMDTRTATPRLLVADRENHRLQSFDLDGRLIKVITGDFRRPSNFAQWKSDIFIADLEGRVTVIDADDKVVGHFGDNPDPSLRANFGVPNQKWQPAVFSAPHSLRFDKEGNLYVMDWNVEGRVSKFRRL